MGENGPAGTEVGAGGAPGTRQRLPAARERPTEELAIPPQPTDTPAGAARARAAARGDRVGQCLKGVFRSMEMCWGGAWRAVAHRKATGIPLGRMALWKRSMCS